MNNNYIITSSTTTKQPSVRIDDRNKDPIVQAVVECLRKRKMTFIVERITTGDFVSKNCIIEHKHLPDLISSLLDGRLYSQLDRMCETVRLTNQYPALFIDDGTEEQQRNADYSRVNWDSVIGSLGSVFSRYGINICWVRSVSTCAYILVKTMENLDSGKLGISKFNVAKIRKQSIQTGTLSPQMKVLTRGFGLPVKTSEYLLLRFKDIATICQQTPGLLQCAMGVGPLTAKDIYNTIHRQGTR